MKKLKLQLLVLMISLTSFAQVGIGTTTPNGALDITSTTDGLLIPRIALVNTITATVATPTISEMVYNTTTSAVGPNQVTPGYYYWSGALWVRLATGNGSGWGLTGNAGTIAGTNFLGTTDAQGIDLRTNGTIRFSVPNANQVHAMSDGTSALPFYTWGSDTNTGMYRIGGDNLGVSTNGIERTKINTIEMVVNDASNNFDFRVETDNNQYALFSDASVDAVIFGSTGNLYADGGSFNTVRFSPNPFNYTTTIDYVADFDNGLSRGSTIGLGSIEFITDGEAEIFVSDSFSPTLDLTFDLGFAMVWDDVYADDFWNISDIRAKKDITPMKYGLNEIMKLNTISYKLKNDPFQDNKIGLIAQEVNQFIPEASKTKDNIKNEKGEFNEVELETIRVSYTNLVPVLIKAVQEQQELIKKLESRIEILEKK